MSGIFLLIQFLIELWTVFIKNTQEKFNKNLKKGFGKNQRLFFYENTKLLSFTF